jgi:hypothetical protein
MLQNFGYGIHQNFTKRKYLRLQHLNMCRAVRENSKIYKNITVREYCQKIIWPCDTALTTAPTTLFIITWSEAAGASTNNSAFKVTF